MDHVALPEDQYFALWRHRSKYFKDSFITAVHFGQWRHKRFSGEIKTILKILLKYQFTLVNSNVKTTAYLSYIYSYLIEINTFKNIQSVVEFAHLELKLSTFKCKLDYPICKHAIRYTDGNPFTLGFKSIIWDIFEYWMEFI